MKPPKMVLFDYGDTLLYEQEPDFLRGETALFQYITKNRDNLTPQQVTAFSGRLFEEIGKVRAIGMELHERQFQKMVYEYLGIEFSISYREAELILWNHAAQGAVMSGADQMLAYINARGFRSGVISNIGWSGQALKDRLDRLLPNHRFEFIIASSEYGFRKPSPYLFELALRKADLSPGEVWFCGDNPRADVEGAARVGIFPVWYDNDAGNDRKGRLDETLPECEYLYIRQWSELVSVLEKLSL